MSDQPDATFVASYDAQLASAARADGFRLGRIAGAEDVDERELAAYDRGLAEGRRQATEGWERQWAVAHVDGGWVYPYGSEAEARAHCTADWHHVVSRLVGPWEPDEQHEAFDMERLAQLSISYADALEAFQHGDPARSAAALIATAVLLHQALGEFLNGVRRGHAEPASVAWSSRPAH
jgi:hypothetical protein